MDFQLLSARVSHFQGLRREGQLGEQNSLKPAGSQGDEESAGARPGRSYRNRVRRYQGGSSIGVRPPLSRLQSEKATDTTDLPHHPLVDGRSRFRATSIADHISLAEPLTRMVMRLLTGEMRSSDHELRLE